MIKSFRLALCQMSVVDDKHKNLVKACEMLEKAAEGRADIAVLPEMFNCPYDNTLFARYAESMEESETIKAISEIARKLGIYVFGGSIPEKEGDRIYNTSVVFGRDGSVIGKHRKMHLFDIDIPGKIRFFESETLSPGNEITIIDTEYCKIGIGICFDIRFPELSRLMALNGAEMIIFPGAFNMVTGPAHWELLIRTRAVDNQIFVAAASPARDYKASYTAYGNSMISDPWGNILVRADEDENIVFADIESDCIAKVRGELPVLQQRRTDIYRLNGK